MLPVGEDVEQPIDVRIIAATDRPLEQMVAEGKFRADLYQRLNVFLALGCNQQRNVGRLLKAAQ